MSIKNNPYEFHLTVKHEPNRLEAFTRACVNIGVKPILLDLDMEASHMDLMTSSTLSLGSVAEAMSERRRISDGLASHGFTVIREKIETVPYHPDAPQKDSESMPEGSYWESHVKVLCENTRVEELRDICTRSGGYLSRNAFKRSDETHSYIFATLRKYDGTAAEFQRELSLFLEELNSHTYFPQEVVISEFIIYDSNLSHDKKWESLYTR